MAFAPVFQRPFSATFSRNATVATAVPYSLYYDGANRYVDLNVDASIDDLLAGDCTIDAYWQATAASVPTGPCVIVGQMGAALTAGWLLYFSSHQGGNCFLLSAKGAGSFVQVSRTFTYTQNAWYYVRARRVSNNLYISVNTVNETSPVAISGYGAIEVDVTMGNTSELARDFIGRICYVQMWNTDKGALASVPTSPFAVDTNTRGRWTHSDGSGTTLTDTSGNGNHGTISGATWSTTVPTGWSL